MSRNHLNQVTIEVSLANIGQMIELEAKATPPDYLIPLVNEMHRFFEHNAYTVSATKPPPCDDENCESHNHEERAWDLHVHPVMASSEDTQVNSLDVSGLYEHLFNDVLHSPESLYMEFAIGGDCVLEIGFLLGFKPAAPIRIYIYHQPMFGTGECLCGQCDTEPRTIN